ncbi:hypothetical protein GBAR_LOCUS24864 [Geodia barretti]|uniref:Uncharacterized protein n=1 Tax=Geodia barretti TaxID=519541 RepID=A0AA35TBG7_GEOBA|nr:hypothetical protein GBAR_LOCUS24864 [Geodia barretti]
MFYYCLYPQVSLGFIGLSFIGWIVFTVGFGLLRKWFNDDEVFENDDESNLYAFWAGSVIGPFVHILAIAHVLLWGLPSSVVGSITAVLSIMYLSAVGYGMVYFGIYINNISDDDVSGFEDYDRSFKLMFAGGFITTLFLVCCMLCVSVYCTGITL